MEARSFGGVAVAAAIAVASLVPARAQRGGGAPQPPDPSSSLGAATQTPRMADGRPDLNGWWGGGGAGGGGAFGGGRTLADLTDEKGNVNLQLNARSQGSALGTASGQLATNFERDSSVNQRSDPNKPLRKPWVWNPRTIRLNTDPKAAFWEDPPCKDEDLQHIVTKERG